MSVSTRSRDQLSELAAFAQQVRASWPEDTDETIAHRVDELATELRRLGLPEWTTFAALAGLLRQGLPS